MVIPIDKIGEVNDINFYTLPWFGGQEKAPNNMTIYDI